MMINGWKISFFLSTQQTAFSMRFIRSFEVELLIGQLSYNQRTNIYNATHGYNRRLKKTSRSKKGREEYEPEVGREETFRGDREDRR